MQETTIICLAGVSSAGEHGEGGIGAKGDYK